MGCKGYWLYIVVLLSNFHFFFRDSAYYAKTKVGVHFAAEKVFQNLLTLDAFCDTIALCSMHNKQTARGQERLVWL